MIHTGTHWGYVQPPYKGRYILGDMYSPLIKGMLFGHSAQRSTCRETLFKIVVFVIYNSGLARLHYYARIVVNGAQPIPRYKVIEGVAYARRTHGI